MNSIRKLLVDASGLAQPLLSQAGHGPDQSAIKGQPSQSSPKARGITQWGGVGTTTGEFTVTSSTLATKFGRLLISTLPPVVLLTMLSTVTDGQVIDKDTQAKANSVKPQAKDTSVKPQVKDTSGRPQAKATSVKPQAKANASSLLAPSEVPSQKMIRTGDTGAVDIEAKSGSYQLVTGSQGERSYHIKTPSGALFLRVERVPVLRCPELRSPPHGQ